MSPQRNEPRAIIIGCGVAGISLAAKLKTDLGFNNFTIYEREDGIGGTWFLNTYPGVGCDVDSHLYSFSFNLNPNWSKRFADQEEILEYLNATVDKFNIRQHVINKTEVLEASWQEEKGMWRVNLHDMTTGHRFTQEAEILVSCVGTISIPADCKIPGHETFTGEMWHSARWNHSYSLADKTVAVIGNGCSAAQLMPHIISSAKKVYQFQRSAQWINERPNRHFTTLEKICFRYVPFYNRIYRFWLWKATDALHYLYQGNSDASVRDRLQAADKAKSYMKATAPEKYHDVLIPTFPLGCKRRIFDPGYLESLHNDNVELTNEPILEITSDAIKTSKREIQVDAIVLSTGFKIQEFLSPITVTGRSNITLTEHWKNTRGAQAYRATFVSGFPNFGIVFGPNAFPAHNSVIYTNEVQTEFIIKTIFRPVLRGDFQIIDVKETAEMNDASNVQKELKSMVWSSGCTNWNLDANGRNTTNYHDATWKFWYSLYWPVWKDFNITGDKGSRPMHPLTKVCLGVVGGGGLLASAWFFPDALNLSYLQRSLFRH